MSFLLFSPTFLALSYTIIISTQVTAGRGFFSVLRCFKLHIGKMTQWNSWFCGYCVFEISFSVDYTIHHALNTISKNSILLPQIINKT